MDMDLTIMKKEFLELLRYGCFIKEQKVKIQRFLSELPSLYKNNIQFDEPNTLEGTIRKEKYLYDHNKGRTTFQKSWKDKMKEKLD
jgi:hypothetical protein